MNIVNHISMFTFVSIGRINFQKDLVVWKMPIKCPFQMKNV